MCGHPYDERAGAVPISALMFIYIGCLNKIVRRMNTIVQLSVKTLTSLAHHSATHVTLEIMLFVRAPPKDTVGGIELTARALVPVYFPCRNIASH